MDSDQDTIFGATPAYAQNWNNSQVNHHQHSPPSQWRNNWWRHILGSVRSNTAIIFGSQAKFCVYFDQGNQCCCYTSTTGGEVRPKWKIKGYIHIHTISKIYDSSKPSKKYPPVANKAASFTSSFIDDNYCVYCMCFMCVLCELVPARNGRLFNTGKWIEHKI